MSILILLLLLLSAMVVVVANEGVVDEDIIVNDVAVEFRFIRSNIRCIRRNDFPDNMIVQNIVSNSNVIFDNIFIATTGCSNITFRTGRLPTNGLFTYGSNVRCINNCILLFLLSYRPLLLLTKVARKLLSFFIAI